MLLKLKKSLILISLSVLIITIAGNVSASEIEKITPRIESSISTEHLSPNAVYGD